MKSSLLQFVFIPFLKVNAGWPLAFEDGPESQPSVVVRMTSPDVSMMKSDSVKDLDKIFDRGM